MIDYRGFTFRCPVSRDYDIVVAAHQKLENIEDIEIRLTTIRACAEKLLTTCLSNKEQLSSLQEALDFDYDFAIEGLNLLTDEWNKKVAARREAMEHAVKTSSEVSVTQ